MSLDGLRAWIGLVERKLTMRTRIFLVLLAIAIGGAGAALYLALDAQDRTVSESELQSVRNELAGESGEATSAGVAGLEAEVEALQGEVAALQSEVDFGAAGDANGAAAAPKDPQQAEEPVDDEEQKAEADK